MAKAGATCPSRMRRSSSNSPRRRPLEFVAIAVDGEDESDLDEHRRDHQVCQGSQHQGHPDRRSGQPDCPAPAAAPGGRGFRALSAARRRPARCHQPHPPTRPRPRSPCRRADGSRRRQAPSFKAKGDRDGVLLPVHGVAGGVGATTFASNLAWELATDHQDRRAPRLPDRPRTSSSARSRPIWTCRARKRCSRCCRTSAGVDSDAFLQSMLTFNDKLHVFTAPADMLPLEIVTGEDIGKLLEMASCEFRFRGRRHAHDRRVLDRDGPEPRPCLLCADGA